MRYCDAGDRALLAKYEAKCTATIEEQLQTSVEVILPLSPPLLFEVGDRYTAVLLADIWAVARRDSDNGRS